jgi:hypothetical protein
MKVEHRFLLIQQHLNSSALRSDSLASRYCLATIAVARISDTPVRNGHGLPTFVGASAKAFGPAGVASQAAPGQGEYFTSLNRLTRYSG